MRYEITPKHLDPAVTVFTNHDRKSAPLKSKTGAAVRLKETVWTDSVYVASPELWFGVLGGWVGTNDVSYIDYGEVDPPPPPPPITTGLARVKTSYEQTGKSRLTMNGANYKQGQRAGLPDTWQIVGRTTAENDFVRLRSNLQYLWYDECKKRAPLIDVDANFNSLTKGDKFQTNRFGSDTCHVYPTGKNEDKEDMRYFTLVTAEAILEIAGLPAFFARTWHTPFWCIDASKPVSSFTPDKYPYRWYVPYNSIRNPIKDVNGNWIGIYDESIVEPFGQFNGRAIVPIYMPNTNVAWIDSSYLDLL